MIPYNVNARAQLGWGGGGGGSWGACTPPPLIFVSIFKQITYNRWQKQHHDILATLTLRSANSLSKIMATPLVCSSIPFTASSYAHCTWREWGQFLSSVTCRNLKRAADYVLWVDRGTVSVKCLAQEHKTMFLARVWTWAIQSRVKSTNHEATVPPHWQCKSMDIYFLF